MEPGILWNRDERWSLAFYGYGGKDGSRHSMEDDAIDMARKFLNFLEFSGGRHGQGLVVRQRDE
jgi:hypothetical protein